MTINFHIFSLKENKKILEAKPKSLSADSQGSGNSSDSEKKICAVVKSISTILYLYSRTITNSSQSASKQYKII